jgi:hypothetical protein
VRRRHRLLVVAGLLAPACSPAPTAHRGRPETSVNPPTEAGPDATVATVTTSAGPAPTSLADAGAHPPASAGPTPAEAPVVTFTVPTDPPTTTTIRRRPTTTLPEDVDEDLTDDQWWKTQPGHGADTRAALLACIRSYESGGDYGAVSASGAYRGAYQFDRSTWASVGGSGDPAAAPDGEQDARAWALYQSRGLVPWPTPARRCG